MGLKYSNENIFQSPTMTMEYLWFIVNTLCNKYLAILSIFIFCIFDALGFGPLILERLSLPGLASSLEIASYSSASTPLIDKPTNPQRTPQPSALSILTHQASILPTQNHPTAGYRITRDHLHSLKLAEIIQTIQS